VRIEASSPFGTPRLAAALDIENDTGLVSIGAPAAATDIWFPVVRQGDGFYTGLCIATGVNSAKLDVEVYGPDGRTPKTATLNVEANQQAAKIISTLVPAVTTQSGGYIHIVSDQPIWTWLIYGNPQVMVSVPPIP
jgi:hypothetical protein